MTKPENDQTPELPAECEPPFDEHVKKAKPKAERLSERFIYNDLTGIVFDHSQGDGIKIDFGPYDPEKDGDCEENQDGG